MSKERNQDHDIAIIGMSCVFPGARDMQRYWENIIHKVDAISDPPPEWEAELFYEEGSEANDRTYCKRGGYLGKLAEFDPVKYGVVPNAIDGTEPDHFLALRAAQEALEDAGYRGESKLKERTAVIIGRGSYVNRGNTTAIQHGIVVDSALRILKQLHPEHTDAELAQIKERIKSTLPEFSASTSAGLVPNIISGRIANRLDLMGPNFIVDAACASSLVAVDLAIRDLISGRCDMAIAGGVHASTPPVILMIFSHLKALSKTGQIRPFDEGADGTLLGEGVGMVVIKRLADAERDNDRIYAVLKGVGTASDGRALGLLAPRLEGEELALRRAYEAADINPATVELIEAHGTGTPVGDAVELQALDKVFSEGGGAVHRCALGSVKSMISHTMPASGMAGIIKAALSLHHKVLPPTLHCENPSKKLNLAESRFYLNTETRPWIHGGTHSPRRAGVNAFGFGGINAHAVLEEYTGANAAPPLQYDWDSELFLLSAPLADGLHAEARKLLAHIETLAPDVALRNLAYTLNCATPLQLARLAIVATSLEDLATKLKRALPKLAEPKTARIRDIEGIYFFREPLAATGKLGVVFPGEGAQYLNMLADLCMHFPAVRETFDLMDKAFERHARGFLPSQVIFPPPNLPDAEQRLYSMDSGAESVFCANQAIFALLQTLGIHADAITGHSTGEHTALLAAGAVLAPTEKDLIEHILGVNGIFEELNHNQQIPVGQLLAVAGVNRKLLDELVAQSGGELHIALDNCVNQVVLCGTESGIAKLLESLKGKAAITQKLPFARAYHTPWFEVFSEPLRRYFDKVKIGKPHVPLYSCVTADLYPSDPDEIRALTSVQWARTVRFRETIDRMYQDGVRVFLEAGPRGNLTSFIDDTLRGKPHIAIAANVQHRSGILQLNHMVGQLVANGVRVRLDALYERRAPEVLKPTVAVRAKLALRSGLQPARLPAGFQLPRAAVTPRLVPVLVAAPVPPRQSVMEQHLRTMEQFLATQQQVMAGFLAKRNGHATPSTPAIQSRPFITEIVEVNPGVSATARHTFSLNRDVLFLDHTLGKHISEDDPALSALPVVPLTVTMEILAEAGALLAPGQVLTGMRDLRGNRWITLDAPLTIELTATQREPGVIHVLLRQAASETSGPIRPVWAEAVVIFAASYPDAPAPLPFTLNKERPSEWTPDRLYREGMFHGPQFQTVKSIERAGSNGTLAIMEALPRNAMIAGDPNPQFLFDPVILDGAGQIVAFWTQEMLQAEADIFPYHLAELQCFAPPPPVGTRVTCRVTATRVTDVDIASDMEIAGTDGRIYYRFKSWEDRRFAQKRSFWQLRIAPATAYLSEPWLDPIAGLDQNEIACVRLDKFSSEFLEASHGIWLNAMVHLVLSRNERIVWRAMKGVPKRKQEWLLGRIAAKDAVRSLIRKRFHIDLCPADVEIVPDGHGRPEVRGAWMSRLNVAPVVSLSHSAGTAVALAALDPSKLVGIDIESLAKPHQGFERVAFDEEERQIVAAMHQDQRQEWYLRMWCAKEAVSKALGRGMSRGLHALRITETQADTGHIHMELRDGLLEDFPELRGASMVAYTAREPNFIASAIVHQGAIS